MAAVVGALLPEHAIVVDEALTSGVGLAELTSGRARGTTGCRLTGGAIGDGLPMALGAAVACPDRPVIGDPGRRQRDVHDLGAVDLRPRAGRHHHDRLRQRLLRDPRSTSCRGSGAASDGKRAGQLLDLGGPALDFVALASGMGVPATRATTAEELADQLRRALAEPGPHLIDAVLSPQG